jgi:hypothetical protein
VAGSGIAFIEGGWFSGMLQCVGHCACLVFGAFLVFCLGRSLESEPSLFGSEFFSDKFLVAYSGCF